MSYSNFNLKTVKKQLHLKMIETEALFSEIQESEISHTLKENLAENIPLAVSINIETPHKIVGILSAMMLQEV